MSNEQRSDADQLAAAEEVEAGRGPVVVSRPGHKLVVLVSAEEWQRLEQPESAEATAWWRRDAAERAARVRSRGRMILAWIRPSSGAVLPISSTTLAPRDRACRSLESGRPASRSASARAVAREIATAAAEFLTGSPLENPHRVGRPLQDEYAGQYSARRGLDWCVRYRIDKDARTVIVLDIFHCSNTYGT